MTPTNHNAQQTLAFANTHHHPLHHPLQSDNIIKMPPKAADKKPAASKAPATASKAPEKKDAGKKTAASGDKKKRTKARKETYSSYIYKGKSRSNVCSVTRRCIQCCLA